ncbi:MAG: hypothetical protein AB1414_00140 [bacterium]
MKRIWSRIVLSLFLYHCLFAEISFCQNLPKEVENYFTEGVLNFRRTKNSLGEMKEKLNKIFEEKEITLDKLRELFPQEEVSLSNFFDGLKEKYKTEEFSFINEVIKQDVINLQLAKESFEKVIDSEKQFIDAYIFKSLTCLEMGLYEEAISSFKKIPESEFKKEFIEPLEFENLFFGIAKLSLDAKRNRLKIKGAENLVPENIIDRLIRIREFELKSIIEKKTVQKNLAELYNEEMLNRFKLVEFYIKNQEKERATKEFEEVYKEVKDELKEEIYNQVKEEIDNLKKKGIEPLPGSSIFDFEMEEPIIKRFEPKIEIKIFKQSEYPACCDKDFYIIPAKGKIEFKNEGIYYPITDLKEKKMELPKDIELPSGKYTYIINLSNVKIIEPDKFPLGIVIENKERDLKDNLCPELHIKGEKGSVILKENVYEWNQKYGNLTNKTTKNTVKLATGSSIEKVIIHNLPLYKGEGKYKVKIIRIGDWPVPGEGDKPLAIVGLGSMILLTLIIR